MSVVIDFKTSSYLCDIDPCGRVDSKLLTEVQEYDAVPSEAASYGKDMFWDERYANDEEVRRGRFSSFVRLFVFSTL